MPSLEARFYHSATAIPHTPTLVEVVLFGGVPKWPKGFKNDADFSPIGNTVVLRFGEFTLYVTVVIYVDSVVLFAVPACISGVLIFTDNPSNALQAIHC